MDVPFVGATQTDSGLQRKWPNFLNLCVYLFTARHSAITHPTGIVMEPPSTVKGKVILRLCTAGSKCILEHRFHSKTALYNDIKEKHFFSLLIWALKHCILAPSFFLSRFPISSVKANEMIRLGVFVITASNLLLFVFFICF